MNRVLDDCPEMRTVPSSANRSPIRLVCMADEMSVRFVRTATARIVVIYGIGIFYHNPRRLVFGSNTPVRVSCPMSDRGV